MAQFVNVGTNPRHQAKNGTNERPERSVIFPGHLKNRDCPGKSGTDGHLQYNVSEGDRKQTGPATGKARPPTVDSLTHGTSRRLERAERRE